jgi:hypothetical protein
MPFGFPESLVNIAHIPKLAKSSCPRLSGGPAFSSGLPFHDRDISVGLVGDHLPASGEARQNGGFGSALRQKHEATAISY